MTVYQSRAEVANRLTWAGSWLDLLTYGMLQPEDMPDPLTADKAAQINRLWNDLQTSCGQMWILITEQQSQESLSDSP